MAQGSKIKIEEYAYSLVALAVLTFETVFLSKDLWGGDFWEHAAVVKELSRNFFHPSHPLLNITAPHAFFSPYACLVAVYSKVSGLDPIASLKHFAFLNLVLLLVCLRRFCSFIFPQKSSLIAALGLLFLLTFYGKDPMMWSGFYHLMVLNYVLPYPSTFSLALSFFVLSLAAQYANNRLTSFRQLFVILLSAGVFISHPLTGIFLFISLFVLLVILYEGKLLSKAQLYLRSIVPALILSVLWPYFNLVDLFQTPDPEFNLDSKNLYFELLSRNWPVLLTIPGFLLFWKERPMQFLILSIALMSGLCTIGYLLGSYSFGRLISSILLFSHLLLACVIVLSITQKKVTGMIYSLVIIAGFLFSLKKNTTGFVYCFEMKNESIENYHKYEFLKTLVGPQQTVLSDDKTNWMIPAFSGKVIGSIHPLHWIPDASQRNKAVKDFFNQSTDKTRRIEIIKKYQPGFILLNAERIDLDTTDTMELRDLGNTLYKKDNVELIEINRTP